MRAFNKHFFLGLLVGVALTLASVNIGAVYVARKSLMEESGGIRKALGSLIRGDRTSPQGSKPLVAGFYGYAPENWTLRSLDGREAKLGEFRDKVLFLNFWATWCGPCIGEMPGIEALAESLKAEEVAFLLVTDEDEQTVQKFLAKRPARAPIYFRSPRLPDVFQAPGIPATFIVGRTGAVLFRQFGAADWGSEAARNFVLDIVRAKK